MSGVIEQVRVFVVLGGPVMAPLVLTGVLLWYLVMSRGLILRRGVRGDLAVAFERALEAPEEAPPRGIVGAAIHRASQLAVFGRRVASAEVEVIVGRGRLETKRHAKLINTLVASAPLLGLLGTVSGMIETFDSITDMALFSRSGGGIAGGISEALTTTQMGLGIAIPGLLAARLLEARARRLRDELERLTALFADLEGSQRERPR